MTSSVSPTSPTDAPTAPSRSHDPHLDAHHDSHHDDRPLTRHPSAGRIIALGTVAGVLLAVVWSFEFVDSVIAGSILDGLLGSGSADAALTSTGAGLVFAFVSGLAGTFTACNIAMASAIGPMNALSSGDDDRRVPLGVILRPLGLLFVGMAVVSVVYGAVGAVWGTSFPQLSDDLVGTMPVRLVQASVVFGLIGLALVGMGLASLGVVPDPFAERPRARVVVLGALVGLFLVGRPFPLFAKLFRWAAEDGDPVSGAAAFLLQSIGNIALLGLVYVAIHVLSRGRFVRWLSSSPRRTMAISGALLLAFGVFTVVYWDVRVPAMFGVGWFPRVPWT